MPKKPYVKQEDCIGCELCITLCPEVFRMNKDQKAEVFSDVGPEAKIQEAIDQCPVPCIFWQE
jgi:ferredoxin